MQPETQLRLFIGVPLSDAWRDWLRQLSDPWRERPHLRIVPPQNLHITLYYFGPVPQAMLPNLRSLISLSLKKASPFDLSYRMLRQAPPGGQPRMIWAEFQKHPVFTELARDIHRLYSQIHPNHQFRKTPIPHITLLRSSVADSLPGIERQLSPPAASFPVRSLTLWKSTLFPTGAVYESLQEYGL